jgi:hypothetical protein
MRKEDGTADCILAVVLAATDQPKTQATIHNQEQG